MITYSHILPMTCYMVKKLQQSEENQMIFLQVQDFIVKSERFV